jgi:hypothetical protein
MDLHCQLFPDFMGDFPHLKRLDALQMLHEYMLDDKVERNLRIVHILTGPLVVKQVSAHILRKVDWQLRFSAHVRPSQQQAFRRFFLLGFSVMAV